TCAWVIVPLSVEALHPVVALSFFSSFGKVRLRTLCAKHTEMVVPLAVSIPPRCGDSDNTEEPGTPSLPLKGDEGLPCRNVRKTNCEGGTGGLAVSALRSSSNRNRLVRSDA